MAGIFPSGGVAAGSTQNAVDADTTCDANELFYSIARCQPRLDPAAMNAVISEILNASTMNGDAYDCGKLDNLKNAIAGAAGVTPATDGVQIPPGKIVRSSDGDVFYNCTTNTITPGTDVSSAALMAAGLCEMDTHGIVVEATNADVGIDSFGNAIAVGNLVLTFPTDPAQRMNLSSLGLGGLCSLTPLTDAEIQPMDGDETIPLCLDGNVVSGRLASLFSDWFNTEPLRVASTGLTVPPGGCVTTTDAEPVTMCNPTGRPIMIGTPTEAAMEPQGFVASAGGGMGYSICTLDPLDQSEIDDLTGNEIMGICVGGQDRGVPIKAVGGSAFDPTVFQDSRNYEIYKDDGATGNATAQSFTARVDSVVVAHTGSISSTDPGVVIIQNEVAISPGNNAMMAYVPAGETVGIAPITVGGDARLWYEVRPTGAPLP